MRMKPTMPDVTTIRGVRVRKHRLGDSLRITATGPAGQFVTTCDIGIAWKIVQLLVDEAMRCRQ